VEQVELVRPSQCKVKAAVLEWPRRAVQKYKV
jgi:hypothetical protein